MTARSTRLAAFCIGPLLPIGGAACQGQATRAVEQRPAGQADSGPSGSKRMTGSSDDKLETLDRTVLPVGDTEVPVTLEDARAMRAALLEYLQQSSYEDREALLRWTQGPAFIDHEGTVRIGPWVLDSEDDDIFLRYRERPGQRAAKAHKAFLAKKDGAWTVTRVEMERISVRR